MTGGGGTGAAFLASRKYLSTRDPYQSVYFGPDYSEEEILSALNGAGLTFERHEAIEPIIAKLIYEGNVVARFNGRMEYGPRALGNRSILYHASEPEVNQWLNQRLGRTEFMPFAPATLFEERHRCYRNIDGGRMGCSIYDHYLSLYRFYEGNLPCGGTRRWNGSPPIGPEGGKSELLSGFTGIFQDEWDSLHH